MTLYADLILKNGYIITMENEEAFTGTIAIKDNRIIYVGTDENVNDLISNNTKIIDLDGKTVLPGFIESHAHPTHMAQLNLELDFRDDHSKENILSKIEERLNDLEEGEWILGRGWDENKFIDGSKFTKEDLDKISPNNPVFLKRACGHISLVNSYALKIAGITNATPNVNGGLIERYPETNEPTGILKERAQELIPIPKYSINELTEGLTKMQKQFLSYGITTVHDMSTKKRELKLYQQMLQQGKLKVKLRSWLWAIPEFHDSGVLEEAINLGIQSGFGNDMLKIQGVKFMLDGSIGGRSAAISFNYLDSDQNNGILYKTDKEVQPFINQAIKNNLRVAIHAIGDRAIEQAIHVLRMAHNNYSQTINMRNRIEHLTMANEDHVKNLKELGIIAGSSANFLYFSGDDYIDAIGKENVINIFPHDLYKKYDVKAPINSDAPVVNANPFLGIYSLVTRKTKNGTVLGENRAVSVMDALKAYTLDASFSSFEEELIGSIKTGKIADVIVISENPLEIDVEEIKKIKVLLTISNGKIEYNNLL